MKYRTSARTLALVLAGLLTIPPVSAQAVTFADMNNVPWPGAEKSINKAAELKLVVGETINGKNYFKPKDPVSLTQACQLAYKLLTETGKAKADSSVQEKWTTVMNTYKIQSWAHPAVSFCLEEGIISISDLGGFVSGEVNKSATREQAAEILGRALTVGVPSKKATATSTIFKDNASISSDAIPYIALLNAEKIVNGDDLGKFNPKSTLNRTETAVMVTNLYEVLNSAATVVKPESLGTQSGTIKDMNNLYVNFENSNAYFLYASTGATVTLNGDSATVSEIVTLFKEGNVISATLTLDSNNRITKMAATCEEAKEEEKLTKGELTKMTYDDEDEDGSITIDNKTTYRIKNAYSVEVIVTMDGEEDDYDYDDFYNLYQKCKKDKETVNVELTFKNDEIDVIKATVKASTNAKINLKGDVVGDITKLKYDSEDEGEIKIKGKTYKIENVYDIEIEIDGDDADWDELYEWFEEYEEDDEYLYGAVNLDSDDYVEEILVLTKTSTVQGEEEEGEVDEVTFEENDEEGTITVDGEEYDAPETDYVDIDIEDGNSKIDTWKELYQAYEDGKTLNVTLDVDGDEVLEITGEVTKASGRLSTFGADYLTLKGKKSKVSVRYNFEISDEDEDEDKEKFEEETQTLMENVDVDINGLNYVTNLYQLKDWLDDARSDGDLQLSGYDNFQLEMKLDKDGYITEISGKYSH